ncbi:MULTISPECIES: hypothetical protein [Micromonospora]|uniref:hypothetical protein n=1 Tax=Micromonospora TaxID=1873 RepID=UPI0012F95E2E|nr:MULTISPECIES: hypothetical protein [unclassified Micromonospora]MCK1805186.1 hypothetical protein [Micromonospora sp. R42106]MCK1830584.1 hypothetical protein [Micromonospora sp. R42003]MCK1842146.1 hypothetical protein [Micromonospora sp. R42004]MCM1015404.1 hypothetical protein [Micromonospora sp. XM-20-01]
MTTIFMIEPLPGRHWLIGAATSRTETLRGRRKFAENSSTEIVPAALGIDVAG